MKFQTQEIDVVPGYDEPIKHVPTGDVGLVCKMEYDNSEWVERLTMRVANSGLERIGACDRI